MVTHVNISDAPDAPESLCGLKRGDFVRDNLQAVELYGNVPADVTCERCKQTALYLKNGRSLWQSRRFAQYLEESS